MASSSLPSKGTGTVRTRFAPSPTGFLHIGGARTALFAWAYARHHNGAFILRVEDSDQRRYSEDAVQGIVDGMQWLGLIADEGPYYQSARLSRYQEVIAQMLEAGKAYHCYCSAEELDALRESQRAQGEKPRYDGRWRPERAQAAGLEKPADVEPVVRFRNPDDGTVSWHDLVKGPISIANSELDDLVIARADGSPTYNFCVVVDDWDREITHVIRGDDHVNNTPRQINILSALGAPLPTYGHVPMIHGPDGKKMSKRRDAVSVMHYAELGYLPEAMVNYLARLGWSHGDEELFDRANLIQWFDGSHLSQSPSQFDIDKLNWVNQHYIQQTGNDVLAELVRPRLGKRYEQGAVVDPAASDALDLSVLIGIMKARAQTLEELADAVLMFYAKPAFPEGGARENLAKRASIGSIHALESFARQLPELNGQAEAIGAAVKQTVTDSGIKMAQFGVPLRMLVFGTAQTPALEQVLAPLPGEVVAARINAGLPLLRELVQAA